MSIYDVGEEAAVRHVLNGNTVLNNLVGKHPTIERHTTISLVSPLAKPTQRSLPKRIAKPKYSSFYRTAPPAGSLL